MSDGAKSPTPAQAAADDSTTRAADAPVGEVSGETIEVKDAEGVPAPESKEETSVTDEKKEDNTAAESEAPATEAKTDSEQQKSDEAAAPKVEDTPAKAPAATPASTSKSNARRKSSGGPVKKLSKKQSRLAMAHLDAKPGDYFFIKMKGYPKWPGIIAAEDMLPDAIKKTRPVTAAGPDGTYREDVADGGKNVLDRSFPCMFLYTNEFCWAVNTDLEDLDTSTVGTIRNSKMSKSLIAAHELAAKNHDLDYFKNLLIEHKEAEKAEREALEAEEAAAAAEAAQKAKTPKKSKKAKADDDDVEIEDVDEVDAKPKSSKKRKAVAEDEDSATPKRTESVKKPKLKLNHTPKANGPDTPKTKEKKEKAKPKGKKANGAAAEAEPELDPEQKRQKKEKEILYFRHKLQKGLLTRDQRPKEEEMPAMAEYITKLEGYADLEVSIIRQTKINKVLKAILKLDGIPREEEFKFKERSQELLGKWNKILESDTPGAAQANGTAKAEETNGDVKADAEKADEKVDESAAEKATEAATEKAEEKADEAAAEKPDEKADTEMADADSAEAKADEPKTDDAAEAEAPAADADVSMTDAAEKTDEKTEEKSAEKADVEEPKAHAAETKEESEPAKVEASA